jgi:GDP/UDP-N,N'-diacetylbacillosamine 2-epimerase (hydrolysing)
VLSKQIEKKKLAIFSIARSDFSIIKNILASLDHLNSKTDIYLFVGPGHSNFFGSNIDFKRNYFKRIKIYKSSINYQNIKDTNVLFEKNFRICNKFIKEKKITHCLVTGDRYEALAYTISCFNNNIKIAHLCGGGTTYGALDEKYRNCISNLASLHLIETAYHKKKLNKFGIFDNIFIVGAPGISINKKNLINEKQIAKTLVINERYFGNIVLVIFHPETILSLKENKINLKKLIKFLKCKRHYYIILYPNADHGYDKFIRIINNLKFKNFKILKSLKPNEYHSLLNISKFMIGNSSSGIIETAFFKLPVINLGDRQKGRPRNPNVIDSSFLMSSLNKNYNKIISKKFLKKIKNIKDIYYKKNCTSLIIKALRNNNYL